MAPRRRYTAKDKAEAVGIAVVRGQTQASEATGIPLSTIHTWFADPRFEELRNVKREELGAYFLIGIQVALKAVIAGIEDGKLSEKAIALGVLYDKHALLTGQATSRSESRTLTEDMDDNDRKKLRLVLDEALATADDRPTGTAS